MMMVIDNVMYLIIYFYVNIMLVWRHLWCYLVTFVVLSSYICGNVLLELKLLQVICNRNVVLEPKRGKKQKLTYSGGKKTTVKGLKL